MVIPARSTLLRKLVKDNICGANHRVFGLEILNTLVRVNVLLDHPVAVVFKHHALLVIKGALHNTSHLVDRAQISRNVQVLVQFLLDDGDVLGLLFVDRRRTPISL